MKLKVPPASTGTDPLSKVCPSSLVTVWGADDLFFQMTVVPTATVSASGLKPKLPLLPSVIVTTNWEPFVKAGATAGDGVGVGVAALAAGVVAAGAGGVAAVVPPPQAESSTMTLNASISR